MSEATQGIPEDLARRLDRCREATDALRELGLEEEIADVERRIAQLRRRSRLPEGIVLVAVAGGTGVGKSSLLNALAGEELSPAGVRRPTTEHPVAWVPADAPDDFSGLLTELGVSEQIPQDHLADVAVVDLPDIDSEERGHRAVAESVLAHVDQILWVVDPEKYGDAVLHLDLLTREVAEPAIFVLNRTDRLTAAQLEAVTEDLALRLREHDRVGTWEILPTAADPPEGHPRGIGEVAATLRRLTDGVAVRRRGAVEDSLAAIRTSLAGVLDDDVGGLRERYETARREAVDDLREGLFRPDGEAAARGAWAAAALRVTMPSVAHRDAAAALLHDDPGAGPHLDAAAMTLSEFVAGATAAPVARPLARRLDVGSLRHAAATAAERAHRAAAEVVTGPAPDWWRGVGWVHAGAVAAAALSLIWVAAGIGGRPRGVGPPVVILAMAVLLAVGLTGGLYLAGRREGSRRLDRARDRVETVIADVLDEVVGEEVARVEAAVERVTDALGSITRPD